MALQAGLHPPTWPSVVRGAWGEPEAAAACRPASFALSLASSLRHSASSMLASARRSLRASNSSTVGALAARATLASKKTARSPGRALPPHRRAIVTICTTVRWRAGKRRHIDSPPLGALRRRGGGGAVAVCACRTIRRRYSCITPWPRSATFSTCRCRGGCGVSAGWLAPFRASLAMRRRRAPQRPRVLHQVLHQVPALLWHSRARPDVRGCCCTTSCLLLQPDSCRPPSLGAQPPHASGTLLSHSQHAGGQSLDVARVRAHHGA